MPSIMPDGATMSAPAADGKAAVRVFILAGQSNMEGKAQVVRMSKDHLHAVIDGIDPYREDEGLNRVRLGLKFGYPKFVLVTMDEGLMNAKIDLGGLAVAVRIEEIQGIPVAPFLEQYLQPYIEMILSQSLPYDDVQTDKVTQRNEAPLSQR